MKMISKKLLTPLEINDNSGDKIDESLYFKKINSFSHLLFSLSRICTDSGVPVRFINASETIINTFPAAHTDYQEFAKILISLVV